MTDTQTIICPACGGASQPEAGRTHMSCTYCGTNLTIPNHLQTKVVPKVEQTASKAKTISIPEIDAPDLIRKAQPVAIKAFNLYAYWTWLRWIFPACLTIFIASIVICLMVGALPFVLRLFR